MNWSAILNGVWWPDRDDTGIPCNTTAQPGGLGITDNTIALDPAGGIITLQFTAYGIPDKLEIIHGNSSGTKVATTGMAANSNSGPFDNVYGTEPSNVVPTEGQTFLTQFVGSNKGTIPDRGIEYVQATGIANPLVSPYQQLVWWIYTPADYQTTPFVTVRATGPDGTQWQFERIC
tara:strand:- start:935 stop:1462 length:528 start_codon:yes stop_codon:yes gene_type:complete